MVLSHLPPKHPYVSMSMDKLLENVARTKAVEEIIAPATHTGRQPYRFTSALAMGPAKSKEIICCIKSESFESTHILQ